MFLVLLISSWLSIVTKASVAPNSLQHADELFFQPEGWFGNKSEDYRNAAEEYRNFVRASYATPGMEAEVFRARFQVAKSWSLVSSDPSLDVLPMKKALAEFLRLEEILKGVKPSPPLLSEVRKEIWLCTEFLSRSEFKVGEYYDRRAVGFHLFPADSNDLKRAITHYENAFRMSWGLSPDSPTAMEALILIAETYVKLNEYGLAVEKVNFLESQYPHHPYQERAKEIRDLKT